MTRNVYQEPVSTAAGSGGVESYPSISAVGSAPVSDTSIRDVKENTAFEWISPAVRVRSKGTIGIEFDGMGLVVVGMDGDRKTGKIIDHVLMTRFEDAPDSTMIAGRLRSFVRRRKPDVHIVLSTPRAVVRHFLLPPVPARQRMSAALWEGQKLIPFSLKDGGALWGLDFASAGDRGWRTTLVAVPTEDAAPMLGAIAELGWMLRTVSLIGTQRFNTDVPQTPDDPIATISWSDRRGCFAVYHNRQLVFHYNLGPMPNMPAGMERGVTPDTMATWQRWVDSLGVAVSDALDFHLNVNPTIPPSQLRLYGLPQSAAPLLTEWDSRFPRGVVVGDPIASCHDGLPEGVVSWISAKPGSVAPVLAAMCGTVSVDLTPPRIQQERVLLHRERIARSAGVLSVLAMLVMSGLMLSRIGGHQSNTKQLVEEVGRMQSSSVSQTFEQSVATTANRQLLMSALSQSGETWMPWVKTVFAALPGNANLSHFDIQHQAERNQVLAHIEGTLSPTDVGQAITYREWFDRLRPLCASAPVLISEKSVDVLGTKHSAFTIELIAPTSLIPLARGAQ